MKKKRSFRRLLSYEFRIGAKVTVFRYMFICLMLLMLIGSVAYQAHQTGQPLRFWDMYSDMWMGVPIYVDNQISQFKLPVLIVFMVTFMLFLVGSYPKQDMQGYGKYEFLYASRKRWWVSKCIWVFLNILAYYAVLMLMLAVFTLVQAKSLESLSVSLSATFLSVGKSKTGFLCNVVLLPLLTAEALGMLQTFVGVFLKPIYGYVVIETVIIVSAYKENPFLIGNYMMMLRNRFFVPGPSMEFKVGVIICIILYVILFLGGYVLIRHRDILLREDELD